MAKRMATGDEAQIKRKKFRALLARNRLTVMPGGFSPMYARLAQEAGYECFFLAGSQLSAFLYGLPDNGLIGLRDVVDHARHIAARTDIPILIDCDTGFGNAVNVHYTVQECIRAGVAGLQIEDQEAPKKSGTLAGRRCVPIEEAVGKYRAAVAARDELDPSFVICARCDVLGAEGGSFEDALERCIAYVKDGGVDFVWLNSVETREQLREACRRIPAPVLAIWAGHDAPPSHAEYEKLGLRIVLYPTMTSNAGIQAAWQLLNDLRADGNTALSAWRRDADASRWGRVDRRKLLNTDKIKEIEREFLPKGQQRKYSGTWGHNTAFSGTIPEKRKPSPKNKRT
ncbi:MAG: isocitrate lyase/PEP mutase family protein [Gemmatimonas sp.]